PVQERTARRGESEGVPRPPRRDHRVRELQEVGHRHALVVGPVVVRIPTAVRARDQLIDLVVDVRAVLRRVGRTVAGSKCDPLGVAVDEGVDTAVDPGLTDERIVRRNGAVTVDAPDLAAQLTEVLWERSDLVVTGREPELAIRPEANPAAVVRERPR